MNGSELFEANEQNHFWVTISNDLRPDNRRSKVVRPVNKLIGYTGRSFDLKWGKVVRMLLNALVAFAPWMLRPCLVSLLLMQPKTIWRVQRKAIWMNPRLLQKLYTERLKKLNLSSLSHRWLHGDLTEVFNILRGFDNVNMSDYWLLIGRKPPEIIISK